MLGQTTGEVIGIVLGELEEPEVDEHTAWLFVPARRVLGPGEEVLAELRRLADGRRALLAYTSLPALVESCGEQQSWMSFPADWLPTLKVAGGFDTVAVNLVLPPELRTKPEETRWPGKSEDWDD